MIENKKIKKMVYGGDYNPEQWTEDVWQEDMRMFKLAGIDIVTLNVFNWAMLQRDDEVYDFSMLDKVMQLVKENGLYICLATSTGAHPAWMAKKHPDILRTEFNGMRRKFGGRHNSCPSSETYQKYSVRLAQKLAERYKDYDNIVAWHVSNEFGGECYCENCEKAFRGWLKEKYQTLEAVNRAWNTNFWGHTFYDWDEIVVPDMRSEHFAPDRTMFQGISLDYRRFMSDAMLSCYRAEYEALKKITPDIPVTTNLMGLYKPLDYQKWGKYMDFVSWDNYPSNEDSYCRTAMSHDLMRGLKQGKPFALMEQTPSVTNWLAYNALKRPGVMRLWSYQAVAHGADTVMFFQMRRSIGACEKYHGAVIDHVGHENTRVFREIAELGKELEGIGEQTLGGRTEAKIAILFDWDNWWALEYSAGPSCDLHYLDEVKRYYEALRRVNYDIDMISVEDELDSYALVIAPLMYMVKGTNDEKIKAFVAKGGTFISTFFSGIVQENDLVTTGGYPGKLRNLLGIWVEETDALPAETENSFVYEGVRYPARILCDILHEEGASAQAWYETDFYAGFPVITCNAYGDGKAYYVATASEDAFYQAFLKKVCTECGIEPVVATEIDSKVEATSRTNAHGRFLFLMNHNDTMQKVHVTGTCTDIISNRTYAKEEISLEPKGVAILRFVEE